MRTNYTIQGRRGFPTRRSLFHFHWHKRVSIRGGIEYLECRCGDRRANTSIFMHPQVGLDYSWLEGGPEKEPLTWPKGDFPKFEDSPLGRS